ncbi:MAG: hypothetical protein L0Z50_18000 [Verrucomicrobiales bacterium]|nr:hypothetical protein [Verrucomicrobiales bacterium]
MLKTASLLRLLNELVLLLLGGLLVWVALTERFFPDRRSLPWLLLGACLGYWGWRAAARAGRYPSRWEHYVRGGSLALVGLIMLGMAWAPFDWIKSLLITAGAILILRGLAETALFARSS